MNKSKELGQVFTPKVISDYMINECIKNWRLSFPNISIKEIKIFEPSVGKGVFIESIIEALKSEYIKEGIEFNYEYIFNNVIYAMDIDSDMISYCIEKFKLKDIKHNFICDNTLLCDVLGLYNIKDGFDIVIGNPPYGNLLTIKEKSLLIKKYKYSTDKEIASPFLEKAIVILKTSGNLSYIITYAITFSKEFSQNRNQISKSFEKTRIFTFDRDKCKIFENMSQTVSIIQCFNKDMPINKGIFTSRMFRETPIIKEIKTNNVNKYLLPIGSTFSDDHRLPKIGEDINLLILQDLLLFNNKVKNIKNKDNGEVIYIRTSGNYWYNAWDKIPYQSSKIKEYKILPVFSDFLLLLMNSSIFYFWFRIYGDGRDMNVDILEEMPIPEKNNIMRYSPLLLKIKESFLKDVFSVFDIDRSRFLTSNIKDKIDFLDLFIGKKLYNLDYQKIVHIMQYDKEVRTGLKLSNTIVAIIDKIICLQKENQISGITLLEKQIDQMVYELYGLTEDEINIVEESTKKG